MTELRRCHYCSGPIPDGEKAIATATGGWAHFECWLDRVPFKRDPVTGERLEPERHG
jgi:hypothetical protein